MMETMSDLKNNKLKKQGSANSGDSIMQRIKTFLKNLEKKFNRGSIEALRVSLDDIKNVKTKGKWWLVGASWVGVQYDPNESNSKSDQHRADQKKNTDELTQLAKQQSMNTEIRKAIFTVLMSSNVHN
jgi:nucleolar MIF4G domain-containing protein 1